MQDILSSAFSNLAVAMPILLVLIGAVILYLVLMVRAVIEMLRHDAHGVLLTLLSWR